jgi:hypothetical protein
VVHCKDMDTVFYSWQSDLDSATNRDLIKRALEIALSRIRKDASIISRPEFDEAVRGEKGAAHIARVIFPKIRQTKALVSDVSLIHTNPPSPNPNVLTELGYAAGTIGWSRIVPVFNSAYGKKNGRAEPKAVLPFDIGFRSLIIYHLTKSDAVDKDKRKAVRDDLSAQLEHRLKDMFVRIEARPPTIDLSAIPYLYFKWEREPGGSGTKLRMLLDVLESYAIEVEYGLDIAGKIERHFTQTILRQGQPLPLVFDVKMFPLPVKMFAQFSTIERKRFRMEQTLNGFQGGEPDLTLPEFFVWTKAGYQKIGR